jgi:RNA recognition motif-containing protein
MCFSMNSVCVVPYLNRSLFRSRTYLHLSLFRSRGVPRTAFRVTFTCPSPFSPAVVLSQPRSSARPVAPSISQADIAARFAHESLSSVRLVLDEEKNSKGFAFLDFSSEDGCKAVCVTAHCETGAGASAADGSALRSPLVRDWAPLLRHSSKTANVWGVRT